MEAWAEEDDLFLEDDEDVYHEALLVGPTALGLILATLDFDVYLWDPASSDDYYFDGLRGGAPRGLVGQDLYRFAIGNLRTHAATGRLSHSEGDYWMRRSRPCRTWSRRLRRGQWDVKALPSPWTRDTSDLHTLLVQYDGRGQRFRVFSESVTQRSELAFADFPIQDPPTTKRLLDEIMAMGHTPLQRHDWWRNLLGRQASDHVIADYAFLSEILQHMLCYDRLHRGELALWNSLAQDSQLNEGWVASERNPVEASARRCDETWIDDRQFVFGRCRRPGRVSFSPLFENWNGEPRQLAGNNGAAAQV